MNDPREGRGAAGGVAVARPALPSRGLRWGLRWVVLGMVWLAVGSRAQVATNAPGDPALVLSQVFPASSAWRPPRALGFKVEIVHPFAGGQSTFTPWRVAPPGGWGGALRLRVRDASGTEVSWPFQLSAPGRDQPLEVFPALTAGAAFILDPAVTNVVIAPGAYTVQAELAAAAGDGWHGQVSSAPLAFTVLGRVEPRLTLEPVVKGALVAGWPWGVRATLSMPVGVDAATWQIPGGSRDWPTNAQLIVQDAQGNAVSWGWATPRLPFSDSPWLSPGSAYAAAYFRLPGTNTAPIPPGTYTMRARFASTLQHPVHDYWKGAVESAALLIVVEAAPVVPDIPALGRKYRWEAEDALEAAQVLRIEATEVGVATERRLDLTRQAATPLLRAEAAAQQWLLLDPRSPLPALLMSRIILAQDYPIEAAAWVRRGQALDAALPARDPDGTTADPSVPNLFLQLWRQRVDAVPEVPNATLTPELQFMLQVLRGVGPEPTTLAEQDRYFALDPRGQWAATATASSEYASANYSAARATGAPDVPFYGDNIHAWATRLADAADEWIELTFASPMRATGVRVRQNYNPGAIVRIELVDTGGLAQVVFDGVDTNAYPRATIGWLSVPFPATAQPVAKVRLSLDSVRVRGWNEIDAVQLVGVAVGTTFPPHLEFAPPTTGTADLVISAWPDGFVLERARRLSPPDWSVLAVRPPVTIPRGEAAEFFRLVEAE